MHTCGNDKMSAQPYRCAMEDNSSITTNHSKELPSFLRKTLEMICACDETGDLACWSTSGETFVVKDPDAFAANVIPRFFKREFILVDRR